MATIGYGYGARPQILSGTRLRRTTRQLLESAKTTCVCAAITATAGVAGLSLAPRSIADATADLTSAVAAARASCPPLRPDPVLESLAQRANNETAANIEHTARYQPFEDPMPALRVLGYSAGKAKLVAGYGKSEDKAVHGVTVLGWEAIPDCTYTKFGINTLDNSAKGYALAALVLASD